MWGNKAVDALNQANKAVHSQVGRDSAPVKPGLFKKLAEDHANRKPKGKK